MAKNKMAEFVNMNKNDADKMINAFRLSPKRFCRNYYLFQFIVILLNFGDIRHGNQDVMQLLSHLYPDKEYFSIFDHFFHYFRFELLKFDKQSSRSLSSNFYVQLLEYIECFLSSYLIEKIISIDTKNFVCMLWVIAQHTGNYEKVIGIIESFLKVVQEAGEILGFEEKSLVIHCIIQANIREVSTPINSATFSSISKLCSHNEAYIDGVVEVIMSALHYNIDGKTFAKFCFQLWIFMKNNIPSFIEAAKKITKSNRAYFAFNCMKLGQFDFVKDLIESGVLNAEDFSASIKLVESDYLECSDCNEFFEYNFEIYYEIDGVPYIGDI